jgi:hypothetical protein
LKVSSEEASLQFGGKDTPQTRHHKILQVKKTFSMNNHPTEQHHLSELSSYAMPFSGFFTIYHL